MKLKNPNHPLVGMRGEVITRWFYPNLTHCRALEGWCGVIIDVCDNSGTLCVQFDSQIFDNELYPSQHHTGCSNRGGIDYCAYVTPKNFRIFFKSRKLSVVEYLDAIRQIKPCMGNTNNTVRIYNRNLLLLL